MPRMELIAPCHFGLEAVLKREIEDEGWEILSTDDGRVVFAGDEYTAAMANIRLRTAERVMLKVGEFEAASYDALFEGTKALPLEDYLPENARFWVTKASSVRSRLFSPSDIQSVMKKAMVERMKSRYARKHFPEDGASYPFRVSLKKDVVTVALDMSGASLHKRGYRVSPVIAPISETLAAGIILLSPWKSGRILVDPFCGSGTIPIEAAMIAKNIAPGLGRHFTAEDWPGIIAPSVWKEVREEAESEIRTDLTDGTKLIQGYDIDGNAVRHARENARAAKVEELIHFQERAVRDLRHPGRYGFLITNPPYGERISERAELPELYREIGEAYRGLRDWSMFLITAYEDAEKYIGARATRNRKIYNGMLKTYLYQYMGAKP